MGLYIKGLRLPKKGRYTSFTVYSDGRVVFKFGGDYAGQAVEVPAHGRLGDLDELKSNGFHTIVCHTGKMPYEYTAMLIDDVPTVIPAEEES